MMTSQLVVKECVKTSDGYVLKPVSYNYRICVVPANHNIPQSSGEVSLNTEQIKTPLES